MTLDGMLNTMRRFFLGPEPTEDHNGRRYLLQRAGVVVGAAALSPLSGCATTGSNVDETRGADPDLDEQIDFLAQQLYDLAIIPPFATNEKNGFSYEHKQLFIDDSDQGPIRYDIYVVKINHTNPVLNARLLAYVPRQDSTGHPYLAVGNGYDVGGLELDRVLLEQRDGSLKIVRGEYYRDGKRTTVNEWSKHHVLGILDEVLWKYTGDASFIP